MAKSGIYCITNLANGKQYVGKSVNIAYRWRCHRRELKQNIHPNNHLQKAWNKYGEQLFSFSILQLVEKDQLSQCEKYWIKKLRTYTEGYNLTEGGEGQCGRRLTDEQKAYLSYINTGKRNPNYGLKRSKETRAKMSQGMKGRKHKPHTDEWKQQVGEQLRGVPKPQNRKKVICIESGEIYDSITDASIDTGCSIQSISKVCLKKRGSIKGLHFIFFKEAI